MTAQSTPTGISCHPTNQEPVKISDESIESTATKHLRQLKTELVNNGYHPTTLTVTSEIEQDCSLETQREANRLRDYIDAAAFLGASRVIINIDTRAEDSKLEPALSALKEYSQKKGIDLKFNGYNF